MVNLNINIIKKLMNTREVYCSYKFHHSFRIKKRCFSMACCFDTIQNEIPCMFMCLKVVFFLSRNDVLLQTLQMPEFCAVSFIARLWYVEKNVYNSFGNFSHIGYQTLANLYRRLCLCCFRGTLKGSIRLRFFWNKFRLPFVTF